MQINPNKINENLIVLISIEILTFLLFINLVSALIIWFLIVFILNSITVYLLVKHKPKHYKITVLIMLTLFIVTIILVLFFAIAFLQLFNEIESN